MALTFSVFISSLFFIFISTGVLMFMLTVKQSVTIPSGERIENSPEKPDFGKPGLPQHCSNSPVGPHLCWKRLHSAFGQEAMIRHSSTGTLYPPKNSKIRCKFLAADGHVQAYMYNEHKSKNRQNTGKYKNANKQKSVCYL